MMSSSRLSQLIKTFKSVPIRLTQNSKLVIRTPRCVGNTVDGSPPIRLDVNLIPQWRDDAHITLEQVLPLHSSDMDQNDIMSRDSQIHTDTSVEVDWAVNVSENEDRFKQGLTNVDILIDYKHQLESNRKDRNIHTHSSIIDESQQKLQQSQHRQQQPSIILNAKIPEKCNVSCYLNDGGNIHVSKKLEGEDGFQFMTKYGNMTIDKLRGNAIDLVCDQGGIIHVKKACEARDLSIKIGQYETLIDDIDSSEVEDSLSYNRLRSQMINVSNANIQVFENYPVVNSHETSQIQKLDDDDGLSLIDISAIYASQTGDGVHLEVQKNIASSQHSQEYPKKVRVKSNHGHISVRTATSIFVNNYNNHDITHHLYDEYGQRTALVSLGGVNGSFDVSLESRTTSDIDQNEANKATKDFSDKPLASSIHVDSLSPGQISILTSDDGDVDLTLDRKIDSDIRLLSSPFMNDLDPNILTGEDENTILEELVQHDQEVEDFYSNHSLSTQRDVESTRIALQTNAFSGHQSCDFTFVEYAQGSIQNRSNEPDSRFDVKTKGARTGSIGKIDIQGAAGQALEGFSGKSHESFERPLIAVGTNGTIKVESLSWFGAISRRYGIENEANDIGRQAKAGGASQRKQ